MAEMKTFEANGVVYDIRDSEAARASRTINGKTLENDITLDAADVGAAPAGYGLGGPVIQKDDGDWDTCVDDGWYVAQANSPDGDWWFGSVIRFGNNKHRTVQTVYKNFTDTADASSLICKQRRGYSADAGQTYTWSDWVDCGPTAFAPAGYGLGVNSDNVPCLNPDTIDTATNNGWYSYYDHAYNNLAGLSFSGGIFVVSRFEGVYQYFFPRNGLVGGCAFRIQDNGTWSDWVDCSPSAFAPAGYGLGEESGRYSGTGANGATKIGFYSMGGSGETDYPTGIPYAHYGTLLTERRGTQIHQTLRRDNYIALRTSTDSGATWGEWEYVNPPMVPGVEYRTTERINGNPVYTKLVSTGEFSGTFTTPIGDGYKTLIRATAWAKYTTSKYALKVADSALVPYEQDWINYLQFITGENAVEAGYIQLWYH